MDHQPNGLMLLVENNFSAEMFFGLLLFWPGKFLTLLCNHIRGKIHKTLEYTYGVNSHSFTEKNDETLMIPVKLGVEVVSNSFETF